jgi:putative ABC transport system permease protein
VKLALRELWRRPGRFVTATVILSLIAMLLMFLGSLLDGLISASTGAIRAQQGDLIVYSSTSQASFARSRIEPAQRSVITDVTGVEQAGGIGLAQLGARIPGNDVRDLAGVALFGVEITPRGVNAAPASGEAYADEILQAAGVEVGMEILLGPARSPITIIGFVSDTNFSGQAGLWTTAETWREVLSANRPDAQVAVDVFQALLVRIAPDAEPAAVAMAIDLATGGATRSLSIADAIDAIPGVTEQQATFNQIIGVTVVIAVVVIALFFALLTVERTGLYGVLAALGARARTLFAGVIVQALVVTAIACAISAALLVIADLAIPPGSIPLDVTPTRLISSTVLLLIAAVAGCAFSLRRILRIDPASAIGSAS